MSNKKITKEEIKHVARLANLSLSDGELETYTKQLQEILSYMDKLAKVNTGQVEPTFQTLDSTKNIFREDEVHPSLTQKDALSQAKKTHNGYFLTENVFEQNKRTTELKKINKRNRLDKYNATLTKVDLKGTLAHKDLFVTKGVETTAGSAVLAGYIPQYSGTVVKKLKSAGYKTKAKVNQDAWGHGSSGENSDFGPTSNPWEMSRVPGGSSSGSAVAVASGDVEIATGTDTCGSIRMPASYTNIVGIKPTYGAVSRWGVIAFASSLDCPGLFARSVEGLRVAFSKITGKDKFDATSQSPARDTHSKKTKVIGLPKEFFVGGIDKEVKRSIQKAAKLFKESGYKVKEASLPHSDFAVAAYYIIAPTETSSNLARYDGIRYGNDRSYFGAEAKRRIMLGSFVSSKGYADKYYEKAARVRTLIAQDFEKAFEKVDIILAPVSPTPPFKLGEKVDDPLQMYLTDIYAAPASLAGLPSLALPCGFTSSGLPIGMQLIGPRWTENTLFDLGEVYQNLTNWHERRPNG